MHSTIRTASAKAIRAAAVYPSLLKQSQLTRRNYWCRHQDVTLIRNFSTTKNMSGPSWQSLPNNIPKPEDDGACDHLNGINLPSVSLLSTDDSTIDLSTLSGLTIVFCYPRTAKPDEIVPDEWNEIPGARGCTPQACSFRDANKDFQRLGVDRIFGCSTQSTAYQQELQQRVHLPYQILSDEELKFVKALNLPTFDWEGKKLTKRISLAVKDGKIIKVWYPVFPPNESANEVLEWLKNKA